MSLHWLPIKFRNQAQIPQIMFRALLGAAAVIQYQKEFEAVGYFLLSAEDRETLSLLVCNS